MTEAWDRLRAIMGEPVYIPARVPWELAPAELGVQLPSDYRAFVDLYGAVNLNGEWGVRSPTKHSRVADSPAGLAGWRFETDTEFREQVEGEDEFWDQEHTPVFPDPGGLLPWGMNSNHNYCCWLTTGPDPEQWPVAVFCDFDGIDDGELARFDGGFAEFVATVLTGAYAHEDELLVRPDPEEWGSQPVRPLWTPAYDWTGKDWGAEWGIAWYRPTGSTEMPWTR
ncbi:SMI1/KNR4 family protein [Kitasatospora sp. NPDC101447]|uniref:SMI1/KNR4 family protein n=1 Tax=Kitasatospora sp. NPDC101447 TaxID=3364102 RepID=UPI003800DDF7